MFAEEFRDAAGFGWAPAGSRHHDWQALLAKKAAEVERLNSVYNRLLKGAGVNFIEGRGRLAGPHKVAVALTGGGERVLTARHVLLATGGRAVKAPIPGAEHAITSDDALVLDHLPVGPAAPPVVVVGAGYISLEFAGIFAGLGATVHVVYRKSLPLAGREEGGGGARWFGGECGAGELGPPGPPCPPPHSHPLFPSHRPPLPRFDNECRAHVATTLAARGIHLHPQTSPARLDRRPDGSVDVTLQPAPGCGSGAPPTTIRAGVVMFGTGRAPNVAGLGLEAAGVELTPRGAVVVDAFSRTTAPGVWAVGDVTDRMALTPVALMEAMAFVESAFGGTLTRPSYNKARGRGGEGGGGRQGGLWLGLGWRAGAYLGLCLVRARPRLRLRPTHPPTHPPTPGTMQVATACFVQPPLAACGLTEEQAVAKLAGPIDVYVSKFKPASCEGVGVRERCVLGAGWE